MNLANKNDPWPYDSFKDVTGLLSFRHSCEMEKENSIKNVAKLPRDSVSSQKNNQGFYVY
jgi:hypothetical protein